MNKSCEQKIWTKVGIKCFVNKNYKQKLWKKIVKMWKQRVVNNELWTTSFEQLVVNKELGTEFWPNRSAKELWARVVDMSWEQKLWIKVSNKTYEQKLWTKVVNKFCYAQISEQKMGTKLWARGFNKVVNKNCEQ